MELCIACGALLNHCHYNLGMVRDRHNSILERIVRAVPEHMGTKMKEQPLPGTSGANRPDLTIISPDESSAFIVEVCCPFEGSPTALEDAARSKVEKYQPLRQTLLQKYSTVERGLALHCWISGELVPSKRQGIVPPPHWVEVCVSDATPLCGVGNCWVTNHRVPANVHPETHASAR